jgi:LysR family transcriptional regulator (chromosome initiation inhibitor)
MSLLGPNLQAFLAVVKTKTVQGASKQIRITQTGVTQRIRALETQLEATLFTRSRQGMQLTPEGEALLRYCQSVRDLEGQTLAQIRGLGTDTEVRLTMLGPSGILRNRLVPQTLRVLKRFPNLLMTYEISDRRDGVEALKSGEVQFSVIPADQVPRDLAKKLLKPENFVLVGSREWRDRPIREIVSQERIVDFDADDTMTHEYLRKFKLLQDARPERHFVNDNKCLLRMYERGIGYGVLTRELAEQSVRNYKVEILQPQCSYEFCPALAWYPRAKPSACFQAIIDAAE